MGDVPRKGGYRKPLTGSLGAVSGASRFLNRSRAQFSDQSLHDAIEKRFVGRLVDDYGIAQPEAPGQFARRAGDDVLARAVECEQVARSARSHENELARPALVGIAVVAELEKMKNEPTLFGPRTFTSELHHQNQTKYLVADTEKGKPAIIDSWTISEPIPLDALLK